MSAEIALQGGRTVDLINEPDKGWLHSGFLEKIQTAQSPDDFYTDTEFGSMSILELIFLRQSQGVLDLDHALALSRNCIKKFKDLLEMTELVKEADKLGPKYPDLEEYLFSFLKEFLPKDPTIDPFGAIKTTRRKIRRNVRKILGKTVRKFKNLSKPLGEFCKRGITRGTNAVKKAGLSTVNYSKELLDSGKKALIWARDVDIDIPKIPTLRLFLASMAFSFILLIKDGIRYNVEQTAEIEEKISNLERGKALYKRLYEMMRDVRSEIQAIQKAEIISLKAQLAEKKGPQTEPHSKLPPPPYKVDEPRTTSSSRASTPTGEVDHFGIPYSPKAPKKDVMDGDGTYWFMLDDVHFYILEATKPGRPSRDIAHLLQGVYPDIQRFLPEYFKLEQLDILIGDEQRVKPWGNAARISIKNSASDHEILDEFIKFVSSLLPHEKRSALVDRALPKAIKQIVNPDPLYGQYDFEINDRWVDFLHWYALGYEFSKGDREFKELTGLYDHFSTKFWVKLETLHPGIIQKFYTATENRKSHSETFETDIIDTIRTLDPVAFEKASKNNPLFKK